MDNTSPGEDEELYVGIFNYIVHYILVIKNLNLLNSICKYNYFHGHVLKGHTYALLKLRICKIRPILLAVLCHI